MLEHHAQRPLKYMPEIILDDLALSQVSIFAAQTQPRELGSRTEMTSVVNHHHIRHAHMVNINRQIMLEGMRADFCAVDKLSQRLVEHARQVDRITCKTPHGTEFVAELSPKLKWLKTSGIIARDKWGNLPGGEIFTTPMNTNGVFVVDGVVGDYLWNGLVICSQIHSRLRSKIIVFERFVRKTRIYATNFGLTRTLTKTATASANLPSALISPARTSSDTFYRMKRFPESISRLVIPTPSTPARTGLPKRISTALAGISTSGSTANR